MEVFKEKPFKPQESWWERIILKRNSSMIFKETSYLSGDMAYMFLILKNIKKWQEKVKNQKLEKIEDPEIDDLRNKYIFYDINFQELFRKHSISKKIFDFKTLINEVKNIQ